MTWSALSHAEAGEEKVNNDTRHRDDVHMRAAHYSRLWQHCMIHSDIAASSPGCGASLLSVQNYQNILALYILAASICLILKYKTHKCSYVVVPAKLTNSSYSNDSKLF